MKHAIMIMAHKNLDHLCHLVEYFRANCDVFIHLDGKCAWKVEDIDRLSAYRQVKWVSTDYEVNWGGTSVLESEMALLQSAYAHGEYGYFHLISGQDYPVKPLDVFLDFFEKNRGKEFIQYVGIPNPKWEKGTYRRFQYFYPYDWAEGRENPRAWVREQVEMQARRGLKRPIPDEFDTLYGSSQWFSITNEAVGILLQYTTDHPAFYNRLWMTFAPEECYVATVLLNEMDMQRIVRSNCRFIRWKFENGNRPANLGADHFRYLLQEEFLLARKMEAPYSLPLLELIDRYLICDSKIKLAKSGAWHYDGYLAYEYDRGFCEYVARLCADFSIVTAVDMGCGCGYYVTKWRERGLPFAGYDANPYTPELSRRLLPVGDEVCGVVDLTEIITDEVSFELVVCKDVLPYVPLDCLDVVADNLVNLSSKYLLVGWYVGEKHYGISHSVLSESDVMSIFEKRGFRMDRFQTSKLRTTLKKSEYGVFINTHV